MKKSSVVLVIAGSLALLAVGCEKKGGGAAEGKKTLVMIPKGEHPYYKPCYEGFKDAAKKYGVKTEYRAAKGFDIAKQVRKIEDVIATRPDGIAISALDDMPLVDVVDMAMAAGIKVVTFDAPAPSSNALSYIGTLNEAAGYAAGEEMIKYMNGEGKVAVLQGGLAAPNLNQRYEGFKKAIAEKAPKMEIVKREDVKGKINVAVNKTEALLQAYPDLAGIVGVSAEGAPGAATVIDEQGRAGQIVIGGFDDLPQTLDAVRRGTVSFCLAQKTYKMGWLSVEKLLEAIEGKEIEKEIDTGLVVVTKDNVDTYMDDMKREFEESK